MNQPNIKLDRVRHRASQLSGDPRSVFYGDVAVEIDPEDAASAINHLAPVEDVAETAIVSDNPDEVIAAQKVAAYQALPESERARRTLLPCFACWNAMVTINPMLGRVLAKALDYMVLKALNDYPYEGSTFIGYYDDQTKTSTVTIDSNALVGVQSGGIAGKYIAVPFFRFTIAASTLNASPGSQIAIDIVGTDSQGRTVNTAALGYSYFFQRLNNMEAIVGIFIPTVVVATRTLPFLPIAGDKGGTTAPTDPKTLTITFRGVSASDHVMVTVPGYATAELKEVAAMYNLPSGMIR